MTHTIGPRELVTYAEEFIRVATEADTFYEQRGVYRAADSAGIKHLRITDVFLPDLKELLGVVGGLTGVLARIGKPFNSAPYDAIAAKGKSLHTFSTGKRKAELTAAVEYAIEMGHIHAARKNVQSAATVFVQASLAYIEQRSATQATPKSGRDPTLDLLNKIFEDLSAASTRPGMSGQERVSIVRAP
jgi:hypothetical protein